MILGSNAKTRTAFALRSGVRGLVDKEGSKVCRSTYAAELYSALDLSGLALTITSALTKVLEGCQSAAALLARRESVNHSLQLSLVIDAYSVFTPATSEYSNCTDQTVFLHLLNLRQLLQTSIEQLVWCDTRYLVRDELPKERSTEKRSEN